MDQSYSYHVFQGHLNDLFTQTVVTEAQLVGLDGARLELAGPGSYLTMPGQSSGLVVHGLRGLTVHTAQVTDITSKSVCSPPPPVLQLRNIFF